MNVKISLQFYREGKKRNWKAMDVKCVGVRIKIGSIGVKR